MSGAVERLRREEDSERHPSPFLGIFAAWRLNVYCYALAAAYAVLFIILYRSGGWLTDVRGVPLWNDFTVYWIGGRAALHGHAALLYDPTEFVKFQEAVIGPGGVFVQNWPYPPTFFLILEPFAQLPYISAFVAWNFATLLGCTAAVMAIVRRLPAVALVLASPFTFANLWAGQNGFLTGGLLGGAMLFLERRPVLAGVFVGCLTYKPQFGVLLPVALVAARHWRALASATFTAIVLAGASGVLFGADLWALFPYGLLGQAGEVFSVDQRNPIILRWGYVPTVYGLVRDLGGDPAFAWFAQAAAAAGAVVVTWLVCRSTVRYALKAATLSAGTLVVPSYAFPYDMATIAIPVALLAADQMEYGPLRGEQTVLIALFVASFVFVASHGRIPLGAVVTISLLGLILRRVLSFDAQPVVPAL
jgi:arabinofuranan 3-O-arabinosyltransferase